jgi:hypothetical protein
MSSSYKSNLLFYFKIKFTFKHLFIWVLMQVSCCHRDKVNFPYVLLVLPAVNMPIGSMISVPEKVLPTEFILRILWCSQSGNRPENNLAKFGYILHMKIKKQSPSIFLATYWKIL